MFPSIDVKLPGNPNSVYCTWSFKIKLNRPIYLQEPYFSFHLFSAKSTVLF